MSEAIRIGLLNDMSAGPPSPSDIESWLRMAVDELINNGRIDRPVEFINAWGLGLPSGTAEAVEQAFETLVQQNVVLIVGPAIGDNALVATPLAEQYQIPTINWAGSERARSGYMFHLQVGSHEDEALVIARHLASRSLKRLGVVYDVSPIGERYLAFLRQECALLGLDIVATAAISPLAEEVQQPVQQLISGGMEACVYLGLGQAAAAVSAGLNQSLWQGPCIMNSAGIRGYHPDFAKALEGWIYVDMVSEQNSTLSALLTRLELPFRRSLAAAKGYDLGRLVAESLARAPELTPAGVREGLEQVKWLPACEGHEGTLLGFGQWDRGALHGRYLVLRQWLSGETKAVMA